MPNRSTGSTVKSSGVLLGAEGGGLAERLGSQAEVPSKTSACRRMTQKRRNFGGKISLLSDDTDHTPDQPAVHVADWSSQN